MAKVNVGKAYLGDVPSANIMAGLDGGFSVRVEKRDETRVISSVLVGKGLQ
jgi:hypothetical protein